jgi:hypothetical protein
MTATTATIRVKRCATQKATTSSPRKERLQASKADDFEAAGLAICAHMFTSDDRKVAACEQRRFEPLAFRVDGWQSGGNVHICSPERLYNPLKTKARRGGRVAEGGGLLSHAITGTSPSQLLRCRRGVLGFLRHARNGRCARFCASLLFREPLFRRSKILAIKIRRLDAAMT